MLGALLVGLLLIFDFVISIWNAYASGYNIGMLRKLGKGGFSRAAAYSGLGLAFAGMTYVLIVVLSFIAYALGYVGIGVVDYALAFNFIVFGLMIIGFGIMVTIQSIIIAVHRKSFGSIIIAIWNTFAIVFDIASYVEGFRASVNMLKANKSDRANALVIVLVAVLIAYFITHAMYKHGLKKASAEQRASAITN